MKNILILMLLGLCTFPALAQKVVLTTGSNGYVTVTLPGYLATDYTRGYLGVQFQVNPRNVADTQMAITYNYGYPVILQQYVSDTVYQNGDAANGNFPTADSLYRWTRRHLQKYVGN